MVCAEHYAVHAHPSCKALFADPAALIAACIVADSEMDVVTDSHLLRSMRATG